LKYYTQFEKLNDPSKDAYAHVGKPKQCLFDKEDSSPDQHQALAEINPQQMSKVAPSVFLVQA